MLPGGSGGTASAANTGSWRRDSAQDLGVRQHSTRATVPTGHAHPQEHCRPWPREHHETKLPPGASVKSSCRGNFGLSCLCLSVPLPVWHVCLKQNKGCVFLPLWNTQTTQLPNAASFPRLGPQQWYGGGWR
ncbi:hypothetical protein HJG60_007888 [Phyllostomus discolor]|uniref:Uncharacterized protein n=1 Tax=Phyllostomus discolor TaxID=89673 RepID=A0A834BMV2_9CHIR|nr:hypothetical protein HJG60_007888 [Phyllostomus discolor]